MEKDLKLLHFEYILEHLLEWYGEFEEEKNDLSIVKTLQLLFFTCAVRGSKDPILLEQFDNFYAMPYGHIERDIYDVLHERNGVLPHYTVTSYHTEKTTKEPPFNKLDVHVCNAVDRSIRALKDRDLRMIMRPYYDLVLLSKAWYSWHWRYKKLERLGKSIPIDVIQKCDKIFVLYPTAAP